MSVSLTEWNRTFTFYEKLFTFTKGIRMDTESLAKITKLTAFSIGSITV